MTAPSALDRLRALGQTESEIHRHSDAAGLRALCTELRIDSEGTKEFLACRLNAYARIASASSRTDQSSTLPGNPWWKPHPVRAFPRR